MTPYRNKLELIIEVARCCIVTARRDDVYLPDGRLRSGHVPLVHCHKVRRRTRRQDSQAHAEDTGHRKDLQGTVGRLVLHWFFRHVLDRDVSSDSTGKFFHLCHRVAVSRISKYWIFTYWILHIHVKICDAIGRKNCERIRKIHPLLNTCTDLSHKVIRLHWYCALWAATCACANFQLIWLHQIFSMRYSRNCAYRYIFWNFWTTKWSNVHRL